VRVPPFGSDRWREGAGTCAAYIDKGEGGGPQAAPGGLLRRLRQRRCQLCQMPLASLADEVLKDRHAPGDPCQFLGRDRIVRRVARVDIGLPQQLEAAAVEPGGAWPGLDEGGGEAFRLTAQEA
jgi:hypothetical protein